MFYVTIKVLSHKSSNVLDTIKVAVMTVVLSKHALTYTVILRLVQLRRNGIIIARTSPVLHSQTAVMFM